MLDFVIIYEIIIVLTRVTRFTGLASLLIKPDMVF